MKAALMSTPYEIFAASLERLVPTGPLGLAISGGADSMALLHLMAAWNAARAESMQVTALTVDHGLRPESSTEALAVQGWAADLGIDHEILVWDGDKPGANVESLAREARYELLGAWCHRTGAKSLITAHHLDDQAETFLLRLARGSGVSGLRAMKAVRVLDEHNGEVRLLRPLLELSKQDLQSLLRDVKQPWFNDPTNEDLAYARANVRALRETFEEIGLGTGRIVATAARMALADDVLQKAADDLWARACAVTRFGEVILDRGVYGVALEDTRLRVLARSLKGVGGASYGPRYEPLRRLDKALVEGEIGNGVTLHGCKVEKDGANIRICRELRSARAGLLVARGAAHVWDGRFEMAWPADETSHDVRCLGENGLVALAEAGWQAPEDMPKRQVLATLPGFWEGETLVSAPLIGYGSKGFKARFIIFS